MKHQGEYCLRKAHIAHIMTNWRSKQKTTLTKNPSAVFTSIALLLSHCSLPAVLSAINNALVIQTGC